MGATEVRADTFVEAAEQFDPEDRGPELRVLGEIRLDGVSRPMTSQQLSLLSFLVCAGPANRRTIVDALWAGQRISAQRVSNLLVEVRAAVGRHHFPDPIHGKYHVVGVGTDLQRFLRGVDSICGTGINDRGALSSNLGSVSVSGLGVSGLGVSGLDVSGLDVSGLDVPGVNLPGIDLQRLDVPPTDVSDSSVPGFAVSSERVLSAITGVPFTVPSARYWPWLDDRPELVSVTEEAVAAGVLAMAKRLRRDGWVAAAVRALQQGLLACPLDEELTIALVRAYRTEGRVRHAHRLVTGWEARVRRLGCGEPSAGPREQLAAG